MPNPVRKHRHPRRRPVHLVFKAHPFGEKYSGRTRGIKTHIYEEGKGMGLDYELNLDDIPESLDSEHYSQHTKSRYEFFSRARKSGVKIIPGERGSHDELRRLGALHLERELAQINLPISLSHIKRFFIADRDFHLFRHALIRRTIAESPKPLEANVGTGHSLLSRELKNMKIKSSRTIRPQLKEWHITIMQRLMRGESPDNISTLDYKRGAISVFCSSISFLEAVVAKPFKTISSKDIDFAAIVENALIDRLSEKQLDEVLRSIWQPRSINRLFTINGLPEKPTRRQLIQFLEENSKYYRMRKAQKKKR